MQPYTRLQWARIFEIRGNFVTVHKQANKQASKQPTIQTL